jgi:hypothetical protein
VILPPSVAISESAIFLQISFERAYLISTYRPSKPLLRVTRFGVLRYAVRSCMANESGADGREVGKSRQDSMRAKRMACVLECWAETWCWGLISCPTDIGSSRFRCVRSGWLKCHIKCNTWFELVGDIVVSIVIFLHGVRGSF